MDSFIPRILFRFRAHVTRSQGVLFACSRILAVIGLVGAVASASMQPAFAAAGINRMISYQAKLLDSGGSAVTDGSYNIKFSLYDAASSGNRVWTASGSNSSPSAVSVTVTSGLFTIYLGDSGQNALDDSINWNSSNLYLGVTVGSDSEMTPRKQLTAAPYAFNANQVQGMSPSSTAFGSSSVFTINQGSNTAATGTRSALEVRSSGTSNSNDFLIRAINDLNSTVFSLNRQGSVTTTGDLSVGGNVTAGNTTTTSLFASILSATSASFTNVTSTSWLGFATASGTTLNALNLNANTVSILGGTASLSGLNFVNGTSTGVLEFNTATGTTLYLTNGMIDYGGAQFVGSVSMNRNVDLGDASNDQIAINGRINTNVVPNNDVTVDLGSSSNNWRNLYVQTASSTNLNFANGTSTSWLGFATASGTNLRASSIQVNGSNVCLADGSNCPSGSASNLQAVTNVGNTTTRDIQFAGGTSTADFLVQGTLTATTVTGTTMNALNLNANTVSILAGTATLSTLTWTNADSIYTTTTKLYASNATIGNLSVTGTFAADTLTWTNASGTNVTSTNQYLSNNFTQSIDNNTTFSSLYDLPTGGTVLDVKIRGRFVYATANDSTLNVFDVTQANASSSINVVSTATNNSCAMAMGGHYLYIANCTSGASQSVEIFDIHDLGNPTKVGYIARTQNINTTSDIVVVGNYLYIASYFGSTSYLSIYDISTPTSPVLINTASIADTSPGNLAVSGNTAYLPMSGSAMLWTVDVSNPHGTLTVSGPFHSPPNWGLSAVEVQGRQAVVVDGGFNLITFDVASSTAAVAGNTLTIGSVGMNGLALAGKYAFTGNGRVVDISDTWHPRQVASFATGGSRAIDVAGKIIVLSSGSSVRVFEMGGLDVAAATVQSLESGKLSVRGQAAFNESLTVRGGGSFGAGVGIDGGLSVTGDIATRSLIAEAGSQLSIKSASGTQFYGTINNAISTNSQWQTVTSTVPVSITGAFLSKIYGNRLYTIGTSSTFGIYDITAPNNPVIVTSTDLGTLVPTDFDVQGEYAYIVGTGVPGITVLDIDQNAHVSSTFSYTGVPFVSPTGVAVHGRYMYITDEAAGSNGQFIVLDVADPRNPHLLNRFDMSQPGGVAVNGSLIYVSSKDTNTFSVFEMQDATYMTLLDTVSLTNTGGGRMATNGDYVFVVNGSRVDTVDVRDPTNLAKIYSYPCTGASNCSVPYLAGGYLFITNAGPNVSEDVVDVRDPNNESQVYVYSAMTYGKPRSSILAGQYLYTIKTNSNTGGTSTLEVVDIGGAAEFVGLQSHSAEFGQLNVEQDATVQGHVTINTGMTVNNGLYSRGSSAFYGEDHEPLVKIYNATSAFDGTTWGAYINRLLVGTRGDATGTADYVSVMSYDGNSVNGLCIDDTSTGARCPKSLDFPGASIVADGAINASAFDLAERYPSTGSVTSSDLLIWDVATPGSVKQSDGTAYDPRLVGVVSTKPGFLLGDHGNTAVALTGRVPLKVSTENGAIQPGDLLTSSHIPGYAMKATKPGMTIGYALDSAASTSTIEVFVKLGYSAQGILANDGTVSTMNDSIALAPSATVNLTTPTANSFAMSFRGAAYDSVSMASVPSSFSLLNEVGSTTSSSLVVRSTNGSDILALDQDGSLHLSNKLYPSSRTGRQNDAYIYVDQTTGASTSTMIATNADGWQANDSYDFAERYYSPDALQTGDLVTLSQTGQVHVQRAWELGQTVIGVVSTKPAFVAGAPATSTYPIALSGHVPTSVSTQNGSIKIGDPLQASTVPGVAVKATNPGPIVGYALEAKSDDQISKIEVFVNPGWWGTSTSTVQNITINNSTTTTVNSSNSDQVRRGQSIIRAGMTSVTMEFTSLNAFPNVQVTPYDDVDGGWWLTSVTDHGFTIRVRQAMAHDTRFVWMATPSADDQVFLSDGTRATMDNMTGSVVDGTQTQTQATSTEPVIQTTTSSDPVPPIDSSTTSTPDVTSSTDPTPTTSSTDPIPDPGTTTSTTP